MRSEVRRRGAPPTYVRAGAPGELSAPFAIGAEWYDQYPQHTAVLRTKLLSWGTQRGGKTELRGQGLAHVCTGLRPPLRWHLPRQSSGQSSSNIPFISRLISSIARRSTGAFCTGSWIGARSRSSEAPLSSCFIRASSFNAICPCQTSTLEFRWGRAPRGFDNRLGTKRHRAHAFVRNAPDAAREA